MPVEFPKEPIEQPFSIVIDPYTAYIVVTNPALWSLNQDTVTLHVYIRRDEEIVLPSIFDRTDGTQEAVFKEVKEHDFVIVAGQKRREVHNNGWDWVLCD